MVPMRGTLQRAYSWLEIKSVDDDARVIEGIASTPSTDRMGDIVEPKGAQFSLPIPLLWQHDAKQPIGQVIAARVTDAGISITAQIAKNVLPQIDQAWALIKAGLVRGLSIGFKPLEESDISGTYGVRFTKWDWLELSAVTIPANADASIQTVKSFDTGLAATGDTAHSQHAHTPGGSGKSRVVKSGSERPMKKTYSEQISAFEATRQAKAARIDAILAEAGDKGVTLDQAQKEESDTLDADVKEIDEHLVRLRAADAREKAAVVEVKGTNPQEAGQSRAGATRISVTRNLPKGIAFARYALCVANSRGIPGESLRLAKEHYPDDQDVYKLVEKAAVTGGTTGGNYVGDMVPYNVMNDFIEYLRPGSIIGKFGGPNPGAPGRNYPSLNRVGFNERVSGMSTGYTAGWKGEGLPALPSAAVTFNTSLTWNCMSALAVLTKEAIRFSNPSAEARVRDELARAVNAKLDVDFIDPAKAASGTTSPASITNAIAATGPSGTAAVNVRHDLAVLLGLFAGVNLVGGDLVLIMSATMAAQISMMVNALGQPDFPTLTMEGGYLNGLPVIVSEHLTAVGSPSTQSVVMVKASEVYLADDGVVTVEASDQASIEMQDSSSQNAGTGTGASLVSLWQTGAVGLLANREITWKLRRSTAVRYISPAAYAVPTS
jgi:HK97 family phage major capsid protein/HK97 family phage prohead protease